MRILTVMSTKRTAEYFSVLHDLGVDHVVRGTVHFTGMLSDRWTIPDFYPMDWLHDGVHGDGVHGRGVVLNAEE